MLRGINIPYIDYMTVIEKAVKYDTVKKVLESDTISSCFKNDVINVIMDIQPDDKEDKANE